MPANSRCGKSSACMDAFSCFAGSMDIKIPARKYFYIHLSPGDKIGMALNSYRVFFILKKEILIKKER